MALARPSTTSSTASKPFGEITSTAAEAALNAATGSGWEDINKYAANVVGGAASGGARGGASSAVSGAVQQGLNLLPQAMGYSAPEAGSTQDKINQAASKVIGAVATGSRSGAVGAVAEPVIMGALEAVPQAAGYAKPETGSTTDRLNRFASRVGAGALGGAAVGAVTGPGALATATVGAVAGGLYDLAETGMEVARYAFNNRSGGPQPNQGLQPSFAGQLAQISPSSSQVPASPSLVPENMYAQSGIGRSSQLLAGAFR